jgi:hypothetical protein
MHVGKLLCQVAEHGADEPCIKGLKDVLHAANELDRHCIEKLRIPQQITAINLFESGMASNLAEAVRLLE